MSYRQYGGPNVAPQVEVNGVLYKGLVTLQASTTHDWASTNDGVQATIKTVTVPGAALGDFAIASMGVDQAGVIIHAYVSAADTVSVLLQNESGGPVDLASSTLRVCVIKAGL